VNRGGEKFKGDTLKRGVVGERKGKHEVVLGLWARFSNKNYVGVKIGISRNAKGNTFKTIFARAQQRKKNGKSYPKRQY